MRTWMIPWLLPAGIIAFVVLFALTPAWIAGLVAAAFLLVAVPYALRSWTDEHPDAKLPDWLPGGRPPR